MELGEALKTIRRKLRKNAVESKHFKLQCIKRNIDSFAVREAARSRILGILEQGDGIYKIWFAYEKNKDLNIILRIPSRRKLKLVTVFLCSSERRKR
jgi:hypothetical protein